MRLLTRVALLVVGLGGLMPLTGCAVRLFTDTEVQQMDDDRRLVELERRVDRIERRLDE